MAYMTLVPKINPKQHIDAAGFETKDLFFLSETIPQIKGKYLYNNYSNPKIKVKAQEYHEKLMNLDSEDIEKELIVELQKISYIRIVKLARANAAITAVVRSLIATALLSLYIFGIRFFES